MKCPECEAELIRVPLKEEDGTIRKIWIHPVTASLCGMSGDGVQINIVDEKLCNVFQEFIKEKGVETAQTQVNKEVLSEVIEEKATNEDIIKERLCDGLITLNEYDEIKERIEKD